MNDMMGMVLMVHIFILVLILLTNTKNIFTLDIRNWDSFRIKICCFIGIQYAD